MLRAKQLPIVNTVWPGLSRNEGDTSGHSSALSSSATLLQRARRLPPLRRFASA